MIRANRKAAYRTATLFLRGKMGKGRRAPIPACIGNKFMEHSFIIYDSHRIIWTLSENSDPLPPQELRQP